MFIRMPNGYKLFLDNSVSDYSERLDKINKLIIDYNDNRWLKYFNDAWLREQSFSGQKQNLTMKILDRVATYLLMGQFKDGDILTADKQEKIRMTEIPISSTEGSNVANVVYGDENSDSNDDVHYVNVSPVLSNGQIAKDTYAMNQEDFNKLRKKEKVSRKRYKDSKTYKLQSLRSTHEIRTYRIKPVLYTDSQGKKKAMKTLDGQIILNAEYITIGGHNGLIGVGEKFEAKWCAVNVDNQFEFRDNAFEISDSLEQYKVVNKAEKYNGEYNDFTNEAAMEKILCVYLPERNKTVYFDENINEVDVRFITPR